MLEYFSNPKVYQRWAKVIENEFLHLSPCLGHLLDELNDSKPDSSIMPKKHLWLGTTAGSQAFVNKRMPIISELTERGWITFLSAEPLLERLHLGFDKGYRVSQVITGAESGRNSKDDSGRKIQPMDEDDVRSLRDQCVEADIAFFYKQNFLKGKKVHLPELDGRQWVEFPVNSKKTEINA